MADLLLLAVLPAAALAALTLGGPPAIIVMAVAGPVFAAALLAARATASATVEPALLSPRAQAEAALDTQCDAARLTGRTTACLLLHLEDMARIADQLGPRGGEDVSDALDARLRSALRDGDVLLRLDGANFVVGLTPVGRLDLETMLSIAARLQATATAPIQIEATTLRACLSVGFARADRLERPDGTALLRAAEAAMLEAREAGPGSVRGHSPGLQKRRDDEHALRGEVRRALETGEIQAWFQPQICTDTGAVSGFEALARWQHASRGTIPPGEFLPAIEAAGLMPRLGEVILADALTALQAWDKAGHRVGAVGVNLSIEDLRNPSLSDRIAWELDRFGLAPKRLNVEILEHVISNAPDDIVTRNIAAISALGCGVDLDDFGTGHASITSIRRFAISRLKIDRSFVSKLDTDREQQRMVAAILTMCDRLDLATLAEGVETPGEHALLAQLGCGHVQGFGIARPMPLDETFAWLTRHAETSTEPPSLRRNFG